MLPGTAQAWMDALTFDRAWDEARDKSRFRDAFLILSRTAKRWPAPAEFLEAMPRPVRDLALTHERKPANPETVAECRRKVSELLGKTVLPMRGQQ